MTNVQTKCIFLGTSCGTSKSGNDFYVLHIGLPFNDKIKGRGYMAKSIFLDSADEYHAFETTKPGSDVSLNLLYVGNGNYKVISA